MILNCIAVDDEPVALDMIVQYIDKTPFLNLVEKYPSAVRAMQALHEHPEIQLVFLDIRMADLSGMELAKIIEQSSNRKNIKIVFTTAFDQYAVESYKVAAIDYLLKPFSFADFTRAANRVLEHFELINEGQKERHSQQQDQDHAGDHIYLKVEYQLVKVNINDILYIEGLKDYVKVFLKNETKPIITHASLKTLEERLSPKQFLRLHRSYIVSLDKIKAVTKNSIQIGQITIPVTEQYRELFQTFLRKWI
jgi:two-component system, LytTR family, response regulator